MSLLFNADFETQLYSTNPITFNSNSVNQELEYLLFLLENEPVFTDKHYSADYKSHIESLGGKVVTTKDTKNVKNWWGELSEISKQQRLNSKLTSYEFAIAENLCHEKTQILNSELQPQKDCIYKNPHQMSGRGFYHWNELEQKKVQWPLIRDPLLRRKQDFSYLNMGSEGVVYRNEIDEHFQYRGTIIGDWKVPDEYDYKSAIALVKRFLHKEHADPIWSMDSFLYEEKGKTKLYSLCEINHRKTMGYITNLLHQKWNPKGVSQLVLFPQKKLKNDVLNIRIDKILSLAPKGNRFATFFLQAESNEHLKYLRKKINQDFGVSFSGYLK
jgi:hypothetical protein